MILRRFIEAQQDDYYTALNEIRQGRKQTHWMWYVFPQLAGLGHSEMAKRYAIVDMEEAQTYIDHPLLGSRLREISGTLLELFTNNATEVMGSPDDVKLRSSMTLFSMTKDADPVFQAVLEKFYGGKKDEQTLRLLK